MKEKSHPVLTEPGFCWFFLIRIWGSLGWAKKTRRFIGMASNDRRACTVCKNRQKHNQSCHLNAYKSCRWPWAQCYSLDMWPQMTATAQWSKLPMSPFSSLHKKVHSYLPSLWSFKTFQSETYVPISSRVVLLKVPTVIYSFINIWNLHGIYSLLFILPHLKQDYFLTKYSLWTHLMLIWKELFLLTSKPPDQIQLGTSISRTHNSWS